MYVEKKIEAMKPSGGLLRVIYKRQWIGSNFLGSMCED